MDAEVTTYWEQGFLLLNSLFDEGGLSAARSWTDSAETLRGSEVGITDGGDVQSVYGVHLIEAWVLEFVRSKKLRPLLTALLGGPFYLYQSQLHLKPGSSVLLDWHQDFRAYHDYDGLPTPDGAVVGTFIDDISIDMGPVQVIPRSHRFGLLEAELATAVPRQGPTGTPTEGDKPKLAYRIPPSTMAELFHDNPRVPLVGGAGTVFICHLNLVHCSELNGTGRRRGILYTNVVRTGVVPQTLTRPPYVVARDYHQV